MDRTFGVGQIMDRSSWLCAFAGWQMDVVLMVRNAGAMTDYSTQLSVIPAGRRVSRELALCRPGNVFIADGNHGAVAVNHKGFMHVDVLWQSSNLVLITFPPSARVFKQERRFQSVIVNCGN
jgi:hypothetical protein